MLNLIRLNSTITVVGLLAGGEVNTLFSNPLCISENLFEVGIGKMIIFVV